MSRRLHFLVLVLALGGCTSEPRVELRPASFEASESAEAMMPPGTQRLVYVSSEALITEADFTAARVTDDNDGRRAVALTLSDEAGDRFFKYTSDHTRQPIAILIDGEIISAPVVMSAMRSQAMITGGRDGLTEAQAERIVSAVRRD